jgi:hypothetical protein
MNMQNLKTKIGFVIFYLVILNIGNAQKTLPLIPFQENKLWGLKSSDGKILSKPIYSAIFPYSKSLPNINTDYLDAISIMESYQYNQDLFENIVAVAIRNNKVTILDNGGNELINPTLCEIRGGFYIVNKDEKSTTYNKKAIVSRTGKSITPFLFNINNDSPEGEDYDPFLSKDNSRKLDLLEYMGEDNSLLFLPMVN